MTPGPPRSGVLVVDKDAGPTSFDVVAIVRSRLGVRRVGHAGTLDPAASGVLPILISEATKLMPYLADQDKEYLVTLRLGVRTDTQDLTGRVLGESPVSVTRDQLDRAVRKFAGAIRQVPPMYSALHRGGRRLYELAREGVEVEREARQVMVHAITVETFTPPAVTLRIVCGKGTYVRTLAADLGDALGCGAAVAHLIRLRVGPFVREAAVPLVEVRTSPPDALWEKVQPPEAALAAWPTVSLDERGTRSFVNGQSAIVRRIPEPTARHVAVRGDDGTFLGVGEMVGRTAEVKPERIIHADRPGTHVLRA